MKSLRKPFVIVTLALSNCLVLGSAFYSLMSGQSLLPQASTGTPLGEEKVQKEIKDECEDHFKRVLENEGSRSYICSVNVDVRKRNTSYTYRTRIVVSKDADDKVNIKLRDGLVNTSGYVEDTEAQFNYECDDCDKEKESDSSDISGLMSEITDLSTTVLAATNKEITSARDEYNEASATRRKNQERANRCEGEFEDDDKDEFVAFEDFEEEAECHREKMSRMDSLRREQYYHSQVSPKLWDNAMSDEYNYLMPDILSEFSDPYKYSFSVRSSTGLIKQYLGWKDDFSLLDSPADQDAFVRRIAGTVDQMARLMTQDQARSDLRHLDKGLNGALARVYPPAAVAVRTSSQGSPSGVGGNYNSLY